MENAKVTQTRPESIIQAAIQNIVAGNSLVGNDDSKHGKLYNDATFGLSSTAYGIDALLRYKGKKIPFETIERCTNDAIRHAFSKYRQVTPITNSSKKKLIELLFSLLEKPTIETINGIFSIVFGNGFSELKMFDALLDFKIYDFDLDPKAVDILIEYINSKKHEYSDQDLEWFIDNIKYRRNYCKRNIDVMNKFINTAKAALNERSSRSA